MVADALQLLPAARATSQRWSATEWSTSRRGWLFFTSTPETRARLVPLTSLWLDTLVLRLMNQAAADQPAHLVCHRRAREPPAAPAAAHRDDRGPQEQ